MERRTRDAGLLKKSPPPRRACHGMSGIALPGTIESVTNNPLPTVPSVGFISLGCPKNLVDSEVMMGLLDRAGAPVLSKLSGKPGPIRPA